MLLKDLVGPVRSTKKELLKMKERKDIRTKEKDLLMKKFGPDQSLLHRYRQGLVSNSSLKQIPFSKVNSLVKDPFSIKDKNPNFFKTKSSVLDDDYFR